MKKLALVLGMLLSLKANATGGFSCEFNEENLHFVLGGVTSHSFQGDIVDASAVLEGTMGDDGLIFTAVQKFVKSDVRQYWNAQGEFKIILYAEENDKSTSVTILTKNSGDDFTYTGTVSIEQSQPSGSWSLDEIPVNCSLE